MKTFSTLFRHGKLSMWSALALTLLAPAVAFACSTPYLIITKTGPATITAGGVLKYTITVHHITPDSVTRGLIVSDPIPAGLTFIPSQSHAFCHQVGGSVNCTTYETTNCGRLSSDVCKGVLGTGVYATWVLAFQVPATAACNTVYHNQAVISAGYNINPNHYSPVVTTTVTCASSSSSSSTSSSSSSSSSSVPPGPGCIRIVKETFNTQGSPLTPVAQFSFYLDGNASLSATNDAAGNAAFFNVTPGVHTITEAIPTGWSQVLVTPAGGTVVVTAGNQCSAVVFKNQQNSFSSSSSSSVPMCIADLSVHISLPPQLEPISDPDLPEQIVVQNTGSSTITGAIVTEPIPAGFIFNPSLSNPACSANGSTVTCNIPSLAPGQSITYNVYFLVPASQPCGSTIVRTVTATANVSECNLSNNTATASTFVTCPMSSSSSSSSSSTSSSSSSSSSIPMCTADLAVHISLPPQLEPMSDRDLPEDIVVQNVGSSTVPAAVMTQQIPVGLTFNPSLSNPACTSNGSTITCNIPALVPGQSVTYHVYLLVPPTQACGSTITKTEVVSTIGVIDCNLANNMSTASTFVTCPYTSSSSSSSSSVTSSSSSSHSSSSIPPNSSSSVPPFIVANGLSANAAAAAAASALNISHNVNTQNVTVTTGGQTINIPSANINVTTTGPTVNSTATASPVTNLNGTNGNSQYAPYPPYPPYPQYPQYASGNQYPSYTSTNQYSSNYYQYNQYSPYGQNSYYPTYVNPAPAYNQYPYAQYGQYQQQQYLPYPVTNTYTTGAQCSDGIDNDNDGSIDFPKDRGCTNAQDNSESTENGLIRYVGVPQCRDGFDNDGDGARDYPADTSCTSPNDNDERYPLPQCQDGVDNDRDGAIDYPQDRSCVSRQDNNERLR